MSDLARVHAIEHYLYLADEPTARQVAAVLREKGFAIEDRIGAYGDDWLVLAQSRALPTEEHIAQARALFEQIASEHGGYYDGWDAEVEPQASCESHEREIGPQASRESSEPEE